MFISSLCEVRYTPAFSLAIANEFVRLYLFVLRVFSRTHNIKSNVEPNWRTTIMFATRHILSVRMSEKMHAHTNISIHESKVSFRKVPRAKAAKSPIAIGFLS